MPQKFKLVPILLKHPVVKANIGDVKGALRKWGLNMVRAGDDYPEQLPSSYRRTHKLGQSWTTKGPHLKGRDVVQESGPNADYAARVQGYSPGVGSKDEQQTKEMARRNWEPVDVVGQIEFDGVLPEIQRALNQP